MGGGGGVSELAYLDTITTAMVCGTVSEEDRGGKAENNHQQILPNEYFNYEPRSPFPPHVLGEEERD